MAVKHPFGVPPTPVGKTSGKVYTPAQFATALGRFDARVPAAVLRGLDLGLNVALRFSVTAPLMVGLGVGANARQPYPPPGPLGIRTGRLRRGMKKYGPVQLGLLKWEGGLTNTEPYFLIHELGGKTGPHVIEPKKKSVLRFRGKGGGFVFARRVFHPGSKIPPRPTAYPALKASMPFIEQSINAQLIAAASQAVG